MSKRVTIMIDNDLDAKVRNFQAQQIKSSSDGYSYSKAVNTILARVVK